MYFWRDGLLSTSTNSQLTAEAREPSLKGFSFSTFTLIPLRCSPWRGRQTVASLVPSPWRYRGRTALPPVDPYWFPRLPVWKHRNNSNKTVGTYLFYIDLGPLVGGLNHVTRDLDIAMHRESLFRFVRVDSHTTLKIACKTSSLQTPIRSGNNTVGHLLGGQRWNTLGPFCASDGSFTLTDSGSISEITMDVNVVSPSRYLPVLLSHKRKCLVFS